MNNLSFIILALCVVSNILALPAQEGLKGKVEAVAPHAEVPAETILIPESLKSPNAEVKPVETGLKPETFESENTDAKPFENLKPEMGSQNSEAQADGYTPEAEDTLVPDESQWGRYRGHRGYWGGYRRPWGYDSGWGYGGGWGLGGGWGYGGGWGNGGRWGGYGYGRGGWHG